jgi:hypothetical protein
MSPAPAPTPLDVLVIGGGQAGRARWDSLRLSTSGRYDNLPGLPLPAAPAAYPGKDDVVAHLKTYAARFHRHNPARVEGCSPLVVCRSTGPRSGSAPQPGRLASSAGVPCVVFWSTRRGDVPRATPESLMALPSSRTVVPGRERFRRLSLED